MDHVQVPTHLKYDTHIYMDAELLKRVRRVEITTRKLSDRIFSENTAVFKGRGMAFSENREYQPGDEVEPSTGV